MKLRKFLTSPLCVSCLAIAIWAISFIAPNTRWIAKVQLTDLLYAKPTYFTYDMSPEDKEQSRTTLNRIAKDNPNDLPLQIAVANSLKGGSEWFGSNEIDEATQRRLLSLFPNRPELYASLLTQSMKFQFPTHRAWKFIQPEIYEKNRKSFPSPKEWNELVTEVNRRLEIARKGIKVDPENAFFHVIVACLLFGVGKDDEALREFHLAAHCPKYDEYGNFSGPGRWTLHLETTMDRGIFNHEVLLITSDYLVGSRFREVARILGGLSIEREQKGDIKGGLAIRKDILTVGSLMRTSSKSITGNMVGGAFGSLAAMHKPSDPLQKQAAANVPRKSTTARYIDYLNGIGAGEEASRYYQETQAVQATKAAIQKYLTLDDFRTNRTMRTLVFSNIGTAILAPNFMWTVVLLAIFSFVAWRMQCRNLVGLKPNVPILYVVPLMTLFLCGLFVFTRYSQPILGSIKFLRSFDDKLGGDLVTKLIEIQSETVYKLIHMAMGLTVPAIVVIGSIAFALWRRKEFTSRLLKAAKISLAYAAVLIATLNTGVIYNQSMAEFERSKDLPLKVQSEIRYVEKITKMKMPPRVLPND